MGKPSDDAVDVKGREKPEPTIWEMPDDVWEIAEGILEREYPKRSKGHRRVDLRPVLDGILYRLRTGCQWNHFPKEFPDDSSVHRTLQRWIELGVLERLWAVLVEDCAELAGVNWEWQAADTAMGKARMGGML